MVIGVYGPWGSGKTTLMRAVIDQLSLLDKTPNESFRSCKTIWFQAWKYGKEDEILSALIEIILKTMHADGFFKDCMATVDELIARFNLKKLIGELTQKIGTIDVTQFFDELPHKKRLGFYDSFQEFFRRLIWTYLNWRPQQCPEETPDDAKTALVIFIDDLDRCPRDRITQVLETIKLFMDTKGCIFVIGAANKIIESALQTKYGPEDAGKFMDKIVQVTLNLPQILETDFSSFLDTLDLPNRKELENHVPLVIAAIRSNPRRLKRFLNNLSLLYGIFINKHIDRENGIIRRCEA